jgi:hypothetical protein
MALQKSLAESTPSSSSLPEESGEAPWLALVTSKVTSLQYGVVQIVIHDSRVVQVESTEKFRFGSTRL